MPKYIVETQDDNETPEEVEEPKQTQQPKQTESTDDLSSIKADLKEEVSGEVSQSVINRIGEALGLTKKEAEEQLPKDQESLQKMIDSRVNQTLQQRQQQEEEQQKLTQEQQQKQVDSIVNNWYAEYDALVREGKAPKIENPNDKNDPGVQARRQLIQGIGEIIKKEKAEGIERTPSLTESFMKGNLKDEVAGADVPVSGNTKSGSKSGFSYAEIASKSFEDIVAG